MPVFQVNNNFSRGEVDGTLIDRQDEGFYTTAALRVENWFPEVSGSVSVRPGFQNIRGAFNSRQFFALDYVLAGVCLRTMEFAGETALLTFRVYNSVPAGSSGQVTLELAMVTDGTYVTVLEEFVIQFEQFTLPGNLELFAELVADTAANISTAQIGASMFICSPLASPGRVFRTGVNAYSFEYSTFYQQLVGAVTPAKGTSNWVGTDGTSSEYATTLFVDQLSAGTKILFRGVVYTVQTVTDQTHFTTVEVYNSDSVLDTLAKSPADFLGEAPYVFQPAIVASHAGRVVFGRSRMKPTGIWASSADNPFIILPGSVRDDSPIATEFLADGLDRIAWMKGGASLLIGSGQGEYTCGGSGQLTPATATIQKAGATGSNGVPPLSTQDTLYFLNRQGTQLNAVQFDFNTQAFSASDISYFAPHLLRGQIVDMAYRPATGYDRTPRMFFVDRVGRLRSLAVSTALKVFAWARISLPSDPYEDASTLVSPTFRFRAVCASKTRVYAVVSTTLSLKSYTVVLDELNTGSFFVGGAGFKLDLTQPYGAAPVSKLLPLTGLHAEIFPTYAGGYYVVSSTSGGLGVVYPDGLGRLDLSAFPGALGDLTIGLVYTSTMNMLPAVLSDDRTGSRTSRLRRVIRVIVNVIDSVGLLINGYPLLGNLPQPTGTALPRKSGPFTVRLLGWNKQDSVVVSSNGVAPATIASITRECS